MVKVTFVGHSCFALDNGNQKLLIDPFISGNPVARAGDSIKKPDFILISHGHGDHIGDALDIARSSGAMIISNYEIATYCSQQGINGLEAERFWPVDYPPGMRRQVHLQPRLTSLNL